MKNKIEYRNDIQGLRGIAVLCVCLFHLDFSTMSRGYLGVDVFFVISGYLMALVIAQHEFDLRAFYQKRIMRLLPAFYATIALTLVFSYLIMDRVQFYDFAQSLVAVSLFSSNLLFWLEANYFSEVATLKPLLHTWSLAIEEQFYFLFPLLFIFISERRKLILYICIIALSSVMLYSYFAPSFPELVFYITLFRSWELLFGAVIALYNFKISNKYIVYIRFLIIVAFYIILFTSINIGILENVVLYIIVLMTGLLLMCKGDDFFGSYILENRFLVGLGFISYSLYLLHQPIISLYKLTQIHDLVTVQKTLLFFFIILISCCLHFGVERKYKYSEYINQSKVFTLSVGASLIFLSVGILLLTFIDKIPAVGVLNKLNKYDFANENRELRLQSWQPLKALSRNENYSLDNNEFDNKKWFDNDKRQILLIGNSHSKDMFNVFSSSTRYSKDYRFTRYGIELKDLHSNHALYESPNFSMANLIVIASKLDEDDVSNLPSVLESMQLLGKEVVVLGNVFPFKEFRLGNWTLADAITADWVESNAELVEIIQSEYYNDYSTRRDSFDEEQMNLHRLVESGGATFLDRMEYVCDQSEKICFGVDDAGEKTFYDYGHHTLRGASFFAERIQEIGWFESVIEMVEK